MTIRDYLEILMRRKWIVIVTVGIVMAIAAVATFMSAPKYEATAMLRVLSISGGTGADWVAYDTRQLGRLMNTYAEFATSRPVMGELAERLGLEVWPEIKVETLTDTELFEITAEALDPVMARDTANTLAEILVDESRALYMGSGKTAQEILGEQLAQLQAELERVWSDYESLIAESPEDTERIAAASRNIELRESTYSQLLEQYERNRVREAALSNALYVVEPAIVPTSPSKPNKVLNLGLGIVVGLAGGIALAFLVENLDTSLNSTEQIKKAARLPVLGSVPNAGRHAEAGLFNGDSPQGEAFRRLRTSLLMLDHDSPVRTLVFTSAEAGEGKSTVVANLAYAIAQSGRKAILVDAQVRVPTIHQIFDLSNRVGLSSVLEGKATLDEAVQNSKIPNVYVLSSGPLPDNAVELLSSPQMTELIVNLTEQFDMVFVDTPSVLSVIDAAVLAQSVDGVVLVVEQGQARQESLRAVREQFTAFNVEPLGVVVNRSEKNGSYGLYQRLAT